MRVHINLTAWRLNDFRVTNREIKYFFQIGLISYAYSVIFVVNIKTAVPFLIYLYKLVFYLFLWMKRSRQQHNPLNGFHIAFSSNTRGVCLDNDIWCTYLIWTISGFFFYSHRCPKHRVNKINVNVQVCCYLKTVLDRDGNIIQLNPR